MGRRVRTAFCAVASVGAVMLLAACTSSSGSSGSSSGNGPGGLTSAVLNPIPLGSAPVTSSELQGAGVVLGKRFTGVGLPAPVFTPTSDGKLSMKVSANVPQDEIQALIGTETLSIRPVVGTTQATTGRQFPDDNTAPGDDATLLAQAKAQVGDAAYKLAESLTKTPTDQTSLTALAPFGGLAPNLVAVLPPDIQFHVPAISCTQLDARNPYYLAADRFTSRQVVACDASETTVKYLLGPSQLGGADVANAAASYDPVNYASSGGWIVTVGFTADGQKKWADFTDNMFESQVAMLVGDLVVSAPVIQAQILGPAIISGSDVNQQYAQQLATYLNSGALTMAFTVSNYSAKS